MFTDLDLGSWPVSEPLHQGDYPCRIEIQREPPNEISKLIIRIPLRSCDKFSCV
jgi:hypothetical protein